MDYADLTALYDKAKKGPHHTADRTLVITGLRVWDYDLMPVEVTKIADHAEGEPDGPLGIVVWHQTSRGLQDGSRIHRRYPIAGGAGGQRPRYSETPEAWSERTSIDLADFPAIRQALRG